MQEIELISVLGELRRLGADHARVEVKRAHDGVPPTLWQTIVAFANAQGGLVVLGVDELKGFDVVGVRDPALTENVVAAMCSNEVEPAVRPVITTHTVQDVAVVTVEVPALEPGRRPCFHRADGPFGGSYVRVGDGDRKMSQYEVQMALANRGQPREDVRAVDGAGVDDLDPDALAALLRRVRRAQPLVFGSASDTEALRMLRLIDPAGTVTMAGLLALGRFPQYFLPQVNLTFVAYPTPQRGELAPGGERFLDNTAVDGRIPVLLEAVLSRLRAQMSRRALVVEGGRRDAWEYPVEALREVLVNALVHRDLSAGSLGTPVQVELFPDRLVVRSPGGLYGPVTVEDLGQTGVSSARNASLLRLLEDVEAPDGRTVCENRGSGIPAMVRALRDAGMSTPAFRDEFAFFEVKLSNATLLDADTIAWLTSLGQPGLSDAQVLGLARMRRGEELRNATYRTGLALDSRIATTELADLVQRGLAETTTGRTYRLAAAVPSPADDSPLAAEAQAVLDLLSDRGPLSRRQLTDELGWSPSQVLYRLRQLRERNLVALQGEPNAPNARWGAL